MNRIIWLDASRGLAIILLIVMHYVAALESRHFISKDMLDVIYGILRLATPFFMFTFGFAFYITASKKIERGGLANYYKHNVVKRMIYILCGREFIVLILSLRYPEMAEQLWSVLLFQEFSKGGEILIFYFFAFLVAPLNVVFLEKVKLPFYILAWLFVYTSTFFLGINYVDMSSNNVMRFLFFDVYAFFPFMLIVAIAMLVAKSFLQSSNREHFVLFGFVLGFVLCLSGFSILSLLTDDIWVSLAVAKFKAPPHPGYMLFYLGEVFIVIGTVAIFAQKIPNFLYGILSLLGRNTLVSYVTHYVFFVSVPLASIFGGGVVREVIGLLLICSLSYYGIKRWDAHKAKKGNR